jgi:hypothetical protein
MLEYFFTCPHCWETISMMIDTSVSYQKYVEDCEVCCHPLEISVRCEEGELANFEVNEL